MLKVNHDSIEYNLTPVLKFTPETQDYIRREVKDAVEFGLLNSEMIENGDYIELSQYESVEAEKEKLESAIQNIKDKLEDYLREFDSIVDTLSKPAQKKLEQWAVDMTELVEGIET